MKSAPKLLHQSEISRRKNNVRLIGEVSGGLDGQSKYAGAKANKKKPVRRKVKRHRKK